MFEPSRVVTKVIEDKVPVAWDDREEKWYFSIVNVCYSADGQARVTEI